MGRLAAAKHTGPALSAILILTVFCLVIGVGSSYAVPILPPVKERSFNHDGPIQLLKDKEYDKAISVEKKMLRENPGDLTAYSVLTLAYLGKGDEKSAVRQAETVRKADLVFASRIYGSMGRFFEREKRYYKALTYFNESLEIKEDPAILKEAAVIYHAQGQLGKAKACYEKLLASEPDYLNLSRIYLAEEDFEKAILYARKAVEKDGEMPEAHLVLGSAYLLTERIEPAKASLRTLRRLSPDFSPASYLIGLAHLIEGRDGEALKELEKALDTSPGLKEALQFKAAIHHAGGDLKKAEEAALKAIDSDPLDPLGHLALANIHMSGKRYGEAEGEFRLAADFLADFGLQGFDPLKYFEDDAASHARLTQAALWDKAGFYRKASGISGTGENPFTDIVRARAETRLGNMEQAETLYGSVTRQYPELVSALIDLGDMAVAKGDLEKASSHYKKAQELAPALVSLNLRVADLYKRSGDWQSAVGEYKKIISTSPESTTGYNFIAWTLAERKKDMKEALRYATKGTTANPGDMNMRDTLGWVYYNMGRYEDALRTYENVTEFGTNNPAVYYHLGLVYDKLGRRDKAVDAIEKALNLGDGFAEADAAKRKLDDLSGL